MASSKRRSFTRDEKVSILKRVFLNSEKISDVCKELDVHVNQFYRWQTELFETGLFSGYEKNSASHESRESKKLKDENALLLKKLDRKDSVIAEITGDYVQLKKKVLETSEING